MSIYGNYIEESYIDESLKDDIKQAVVNIKELKDQWKAKADTFVKHKWLYRYINDTQKEQLQKHYAVLCEDNTNYSSYKKSFSFICKFMGLPDKGVILENVVFNKDKKDKDQDIISVRYSKGLVKVQIPKSLMLIHLSPAKGLDKLIPTFRSKTKGKYLYPSKRVFFTVIKPVSAFKGGNEKTKTYKYTTKDSYTTAYIDPTYSDFADGSVYIETDAPIPVINLQTKINNLFNIRKEESILDLEGEYVQEEVVEEGFKEVIQTIKDWKTDNETKALKEFKSTTITDDEYIELKALFKTLHEADYPEYKKAFDKLCKFCHIVPKGTIITKHELKKSREEDKNTLYVQYSWNTKKIVLPEDSFLYHMSKIGGIKALEPTFRGKSERGYLYDKPRIYFTINKNLPKLAADYKMTQKMYKYKCLKDIKEVYVDPLIRNGLMGAVYVETNTSIPVEEL